MSEMLQQIRKLLKTCRIRSKTQTISKQYQQITFKTFIMGSCITKQPVIIPQETLAHEPTEKEVAILMIEIYMDVEKERVGKTLKKLNTI